ncbi:angiopoietin-1-like [Tubulanus polymorphus]|uniref:angiopoietin-1-like n=1 Tax=Tubulanus polymorphus TaxID=672921 RepID=UPI003DA428FE
MLLSIIPIFLSGALVAWAPTGAVAVTSNDQQHCVYSFHVWKPNEDVTRRLEAMDIRDRNISSYFTQELYRFKNELLRELLQSKNLTHHVEKQVLEHKLESVKMRIDQQELRVKLLALETKQDKLKLKARATSPGSDGATLTTDGQQQLISLGDDLKVQSDSLQTKFASLRNEIGDLKAEWLLIKREIQDLQRGIQQLTLAHSDLQSDMVKFKNSGKETLQEILSQGTAMKLQQSEQQGITDEIKRNINLLRMEIEDLRGLQTRIRMSNSKIQDQLALLRYENSYLQRAIIKIGGNDNDFNMTTIPVDRPNPNANQKRAPKTAVDITDENVPQDCHDVYRFGYKTPAVYQIKPKGSTTWESVYCEMFNKTGWLVLQRRIHGSLNFNRRWLEYKFGFGNPYDEFWIGNEMLYKLTNQKKYMLRIDLWDWEGNRAYAEYTNFLIDDEVSQYRIHVNGYQGNAGDSLSYHDNMAFSAEDVDNDLHARNCATDNKGGWWYNSCYFSNLNGVYHTSWYSRGGQTFADGTVWYTLKQSDFYSLKRAEMKIRPLNP